MQSADTKARCLARKYAFAQRRITTDARCCKGAVRDMLARKRSNTRVSIGEVYQVTSFDAVLIAEIEADVVFHVKFP